MIKNTPFCAAASCRSDPRFLDCPCRRLAALGRKRPRPEYVFPEKGLPSEFDPGKFKAEFGRGRSLHHEKREVGREARLADLRQSGRRQRQSLVGTNNASPRDPKYKDDRSCLYAFNEYNGDFLWQLAVPKLASGKVNDWEYLGILASPCVVGNKVYLVTNRCEVVCLDAEGMSNGNDPLQGRSQVSGRPRQTARSNPARRMPTSSGATT
jgi:hypothetical protein